MAGSLKDALEKAGRVTKQDEPRADPKKWKEELPEDNTPHIPFEAPARTKPKPRPKGG